MFKHMKIGVLLLSFLVVLQRLAMLYIITKYLLKCSRKTVNSIDLRRTLT